MRLRRPSPLLPSIAVVALVALAACSSDGASTAPENTAGSTAAPSTDPPSSDVSTTTVSPAVAAEAYSARGSFPVGVTTLQLDDGTNVEVWYPAVAGTTGTETYDVRDFTPEAIKALLIADVPATFSYEAGRDAELAEGAFPVVAFSHGFLGFRNYYSTLTAHLASWGMVVVSADHKARDLPHLLDTLEPANRPPDTSTAELIGAVDLILAEGQADGSRFFGHIDDEHIATVGQSAGGGTAFRAAATDDRIDGYVSLASGVAGLRRAANSGDTTTTVIATTTTTPIEPPDKPSFFLAGSLDDIVPAEEVSRASFEKVPSPSLLWIIEGAGHLAFSDLCTYGNGTGIIGVADANGLGAFLDSTPGVRKLGEDGCLPPAVPVTTTFPLINHAVTAWLNVLFGIDAEPVGLDESVADQYPTPVEIVSK